MNTREYLKNGISYHLSGSAVSPAGLRENAGLFYNALKLYLKASRPEKQLQLGIGTKKNP